MAIEFANKGYIVVVSGRRLQPLEAVVEQLGEGAKAIACDVTDEQTLQRAIQTIVNEYGRLDIVVANAGFAVGGPIAEISGDDWRRQFDVNVVGVANTIRLALPELKKTSGRIAIVSSVASMVYSPRTGAYSASKAAVRTMGLTLAQELHGTGVSCTTIHPGFVESEIGQVDNQGVFHPEWEDKRPKALMWPADRAARVMVRAIEKRRLEYVFTGHGRIGAWFGRHFPGFVHFVISRGFVRV